VKELERRRDTIVQSLHTYLKDEVTFYAPQGGIHIWCQVMMEDYNETQLLEESIQRGVIYVPGSTMGSQKGFVRFTYAREDTESIDEGIKRFAEALHCLNGKR